MAAGKTLDEATWDTLGQIAVQYRDESFYLFCEWCAKNKELTSLAPTVADLVAIVERHRCSPQSKARA